MTEAERCAMIRAIGEIIAARYKAGMTVNGLSYRDAARCLMSSLNVMKEK